MNEKLDTLFNQDMAEYEKYLNSNIKKKDLKIEDIIKINTSLPDNYELIKSTFKSGSSNVKKFIILLRDEIEYHRRQYYMEDDPLITDADFDLLMRKLELYEEIFPEFITKSSPTQKVGSTVSSIFDSYTHKNKMYSLDDAMNFDELEEFINRIEERFGKFVPLVCELKIDGLSISLTYENNKLIRGVTRGNGISGEDVTENILTIKDIPRNLSKNFLSGNSSIEIRGEVYMPKDSFEILNKENSNNGKKVFANTRNAASGSLRQKDSEITKSRNLKTFIYTVGSYLELFNLGAKLFNDFPISKQSQLIE